MKLATLVTNTDVSAFARTRPLDDEKFATLIAEVRPGWKSRAFWVCKGAFPEDLSEFDGVMITGSPASVNAPEPWIDRLAGLVRDLIETGMPVFGACFGHQIIAKALGAPVIRNPDGTVHGLIEVTRVAQSPWAGPAGSFALYGFHAEQVGTLPAGARCLFESPGCPIAGFAVGETVFTIQHHPEMTTAFAADLVDELAEYAGEEVTTRARHSMTRGVADRKGFATEIARFFEQARR